MAHILSADRDPEIGARFAVVKTVAEEPKLAGRSASAGISSVVQEEAMSELAVGQSSGIIAGVPSDGNAVKDGPARFYTGNSLVLTRKTG